LRSQFARTPGDSSGHERYSELHRTYEEKRYWEFKAFDYEENLIRHYITGRSTNEEVHALATQYFDELLPNAPNVDTVQFYLHTYLVGVIKFLSVNDCKKAIEICDEALQILQVRKNSYGGALLSFAIQKLGCLTQLRIFEADDKTAQYCFSLVEEGGFNWFRVMELQFYNRIYNRNYQDALDIYAKAVQHTRFQLLSGSYRDLWTLCGGYLHLLGILGKLNPKKVEEIVGYFRPVKFQNDFEVLDKEKAGMNIPLLLLPVMYSIATGAFEGDHAERKMEKEWNLLQQLPPQIAGQSFAVEIIPYEDLWEMLSKR
jgi:hypothetical protein